MLGAHDNALDHPCHRPRTVAPQRFDRTPNHAWRAAATQRLRQPAAAPLLPARVLGTADRRNPQWTIATQRFDLIEPTLGTDRAPNPRPAAAVQWSGQLSGLAVFSLRVRKGN